MELNTTINFEQVLNLIQFKLREKRINLTENHQGHIYSYTAYIDYKRIGYIELSLSKQPISKHPSNNNSAWTSESFQLLKPEPLTIHVHWIEIFIPKKGYGKLLLAYGVLAVYKEYTENNKNKKKLNFVTLDDCSDACTQRYNNIYSLFGFCPTYPVKKTEGINHYCLSDPNKQVRIKKFLESVSREFRSERDERYYRRIERAQIAQREREGAEGAEGAEMEKIFNNENNENLDRSITRNRNRSRNRSRSRSRNRNRRNRNRSMTRSGSRY